MMISSGRYNYHIFDIKEYMKRLRTLDRVELLHLQRMIDEVKEYEDAIKEQSVCGGGEE